MTAEPYVSSGSSLVPCRSFRRRRAVRARCARRCRARTRSAGAPATGHSGAVPGCSPRRRRLHRRHPSQLRPRKPCPPRRRSLPQRHRLPRPQRSRCHAAVSRCRSSPLPRRVAGRRSPAAPRRQCRRFHRRSRSQRRTKLSIRRAAIFTPPTGTTSDTLSHATIEALPQGTNAPVERVLLQAPGVSQDLAASGLFHIRNDHANAQFRINGIMMPDGVTGFSQHFRYRLHRQPVARHRRAARRIRHAHHGADRHHHAQRHFQQFRQRQLLRRQPRHYRAELRLRRNDRQ